MAGISDKDKIYMEALKKFRTLIDSEYVNGGWLPSSRSMCELLNISSVTYVKVTNRLTAENMIKCYPRKGIYVVPEEYRQVKIGIVVANGEESPFLGNFGLLAEVLTRIDECGYVPHMIQSSVVSNIGRSALSHCVSGLIWLFPPVSAADILKEIHNDALMPLIAIAPFTPSSEENMLTGVPVVNEDFSAMGEQIAELFVKRAHKRIIYAGNYWFAKYNGMADAFNKAGVEFDESCCLGNNDLPPEALLSAVKDQKATALIMEGQTSRLEQAFQELQQLPSEQRPEMLIHRSSLVPRFCEKYPGMKIIGVAKRQIKQYGRVAVDVLDEHLKHGVEVKSRFIRTYNIEQDLSNIIGG